VCDFSGKETTIQHQDEALTDQEARRKSIVYIGPQSETREEDRQKEGDPKDSRVKLDRGAETWEKQDFVSRSSEGEGSRQARRKANHSTQDGEESGAAERGNRPCKRRDGRPTG
jgi:hypothetical protein